MPFSPGFKFRLDFINRQSRSASPSHIFFLTPHSRRCYCLFHNKIIPTGWFCTSSGLHEKAGL